MSTRSATPADVQKLFSDLGELAAALMNADSLTLRVLVTLFDRLVADLEPFATPPILEEVAKLRGAIPQGDPKTARDWQGFFNALASFAQIVLPMILNIFAKK